jgi:hypothetical protein
MMSRIALHPKGYRHRSNGIIQSRVVHNRYADRNRTLPDGSIIVFAPPTADVQSPPHAASLQGRRNCTRAALEDEASFMMDTFATTMTMNGAATVSYSSHMLRPSQLEASVADGAAPAEID